MVRRSLILAGLHRAAAGSGKSGGPGAGGGLTWRTLGAQAPANLLGLAVWDDGQGIVAVSAAAVEDL